MLASSFYIKCVAVILSFCAMLPEASHDDDSESPEKIASAACNKWVSYKFTTSIQGEITRRGTLKILFLKCSPSDRGSRYCIRYEVTHEGSNAFYAFTVVFEQIPGNDMNISNALAGIQELSAGKVWAINPDDISSLGKLEFEDAHYGDLINSNISSDYGTDIEKSSVDVESVKGSHRSGRISVSNRTYRPTLRGGDQTRRVTVSEVHYGANKETFVIKLTQNNYFERKGVDGKWLPKILEYQTNFLLHDYGEFH